MAVLLGRTTDNDQVCPPGTGRKDDLDEGFAHVHLIFDSEMRQGESVRVKSLLLMFAGGSIEAKP
jgi:hypothetical protein